MRLLGSQKVTIQKWTKFIGLSIPTVELWTSSMRKPFGLKCFPLNKWRQNLVHGRKFREGSFTIFKPHQLLWTSDASLPLLTLKCILKTALSLVAMPTIIHTVDSTKGTAGNCPNFPLFIYLYWLSTFFSKDIAWMSISLLNSDVGHIDLKVKIRRDSLCMVFDDGCAFSSQRFRKWKLALILSPLEWSLYLLRIP